MPCHDPSRRTAPIPPPTAARPLVNVGHATDAPLQAVPDRVALVVDGQTVTYRQLEQRIRQVEVALAAAGVGPGDRVALVNLGSTLSVATIFAAARLGAASAQMNAYLTPGELGQLAELTGTRVGVAGDRYAAALGAAVGGTGAGGGADLRHRGARRRRRPASGGGRTPPWCCSPAEPPACPSPSPSATGSSPTGWPTTPSPSTRDAPQPVDMMSAPIFHIGGTLGLFISLHQGKQMVLLPKFDPGEWLEPGRAAPGGPDLRGTDHAPPHPRPPPLREHRPELAAVAELRRRGRPGGPGAPGRGRLPRAWTSPTPSARPRPSAPTPH